MKFAWSFSRLKNFETCALRHNEIDILKRFKEPSEPGGPLDWGDRVHKAFAQALRSGQDLPDEMENWQHYIDSVRQKSGELLVEQKYALTRELQPCEYFSSNTWFRTVIDAAVLDRDAAVAYDWKTGKVPDDRSPSVQLLLSAQALFAYFPQIQKVGTSFVFLQEDAKIGAVYTREEVARSWVSLLPRVERMEAAMRTQSYPPNPSGLCVRHCPVTTCQFHGKGRRG